MVDNKKLYELGLKKKNKEIDMSWEELARQSNGKFLNGEMFRCWFKRQLKKDTPNTSTTSKLEDIVDVPLQYKEETKIHKDGSQSSNKLVEMSIEQSKDINYLLEAHGYDTDKWELISARSNIWNAYSKVDGIMQLYSSKITVKPKPSGSNIKDILSKIDKIVPYEISFVPCKEYSNRLLEIPLFDAHFGISDYEYYKSTQNDIVRYINSKQWSEILFVVGQDMIHNNDFRGQTAGGTHIENIDMNKAWEDCCKFYEPLIVQSLHQSKKVKIMYSKGNHDEAISWAFVKYLKAKFPLVFADDTFTERKIHTFGKIFIGVTHGDKARKNLHNLFQVEFPMEWATAKTRELHSGHFHREDSVDVFGMMVRTLSTRNKTDNWHKDNGFIGAHKRFMLFEYDETELKNIHYV